jgi:CheY-like chemotaxis protein
MKYGLMTTTRVLLVGDNPDRLKLLAGQLSERYVVSSYDSTTEALRELENATTDMLLLVNTGPINDHRGLIAVIDRVLADPRTDPAAAPLVNPTGPI